MSEFFNKLDTFLDNDIWLIIIIMNIFFIFIFGSLRNMDSRIRKLEGRK